MSKCEGVAYLYPHEGCAEYAAPDEVPCGDAARWRVSWTDCGPEGESRVVMLLCDRCKQASDDDAGTYIEFGFIKQRVVLALTTTGGK